MTISTEISKLSTNLTSSYSAVNTKGGTLPASQNFDNLPDAILSIPSGGGGGDTVDVKAVGDTASYDEGDKVILLPTDYTVVDSTAYGNNLQTSTGTPRRTPFIMQGCVLDYTKGIGYYAYGYSTMRETLTWNADKTSVSRENQNGGEHRDNDVCYVEYDDGNNYAALVASLNYSRNQPEGDVTLGRYINGTFSGSMVASNNAASNLAFKNNWAAGNGSVYDLSTNTAYNISSGSIMQVPMRFNNTWYIVDGQTNGGVYALTDTTTKVYDFSGWTYEGYTTNQKFIFIDDNADYLMVNTSTDSNALSWKFMKMTKNTTAWSATELTSVTSAIMGVVNPTGTTNVNLVKLSLQTKDFGTYVEIFAVSKLFGSSGCCVAHFIFDKTSDTITRKADVFPELAYRYDTCLQLSVNWQLGLISAMLVYPDTSYGLLQSGLYIKKFDELASIYPYYAYTNKITNYSEDAITGFVTENKGVDALGNTVLEVETVQDPDYHWTNVGRVIGMNVTVNEGEPV